MSDLLKIAGHSYRSRLLVGTGKYQDFAQTRAAIDASGAEIVTVAIRRTNIGQTAGEPSLLDFLSPIMTGPGRQSPCGTVLLPTRQSV